MPCSRTPQWMFRPTFPGPKLAPPLISAPVLSARSAEPPIRLGSFAASAFSTLADACRVASAPSAGVNPGSPSSQPAGNRPASHDSNSAAAAGWAVR